ncbi:MAG: PilZ domain-containing protein [Thiomicrorhabdus sp.]|nr:PilZ domain-containing protein [Thiomicrorhabdus sp.]
MLNSRRYFRFDVVLPMHMELVDQYGKQLGLARSQLISREDEKRLQVVNASLQDYLQQLHEISSAASHIFSVLNYRLDFMWWMLDFIIESDDSTEQNDYLLRKKKDGESVRPTHKKTSEIGPLIVGLYDALEDYVLELNTVMETGVEEGTFSYQGLSQARFDDKQYIANLNELANSDVLPAKILQFMVEKINLQAGVLEQLKSAYRKTSSSEDWKHYQINLSPKGFSFLTNDKFEIFSNMDVYMEINEDTIICRGKVLSQTSVESELLDTRVSIEFDLLTGEQEQEITRFIQYNELKESMKQVPEPYVPLLNA